MAIQTLNIIKKWFQTGLKPSQDQFWDTWDSFRHKNEKVPLRDIENLSTALDTKAEKSELDNHKTDSNAHSQLFNNKEDKENKGIAGGYAPLDEFSKITNQYLSIVNDLVTGGSNSLLSAEQGKILQNQIVGISALLQSDNANLDTLQKIVDAIEEVQISLSAILVNDLTTGGMTKALTAEMGKILQSSKEDKSQKGIANGYAPLNSFTKLASQYLDIVNNLVSGGPSSILSAEQGKILQNQINGINTLLQSDNVNLDTLQEIVDAIEEVQISLNSILVNDLTTGGVTKALTAEMGKKLNEIKLTATIATDAETQISSAVMEDNKIISRSKLFNWWAWIKANSQTVSGNWTFDNTLRFGTSGYFTSDSTRFYIRAYKEKQLNIGVEGVPNDALSINLNGIQLNDKISLVTGTLTKNPLTIPIGNLLSTPVNGAIETNTSGIYYTINGIRKNLITDYVIDKSTMNDAAVYLWGNGNIGTREDIYPIVTNITAFNDYNTNQYGNYTIDVSGIISRMEKEVSDVKFELQMQISNSKTPTTWYTISKFEDIRANILAADSLPQQIKLSAELLLQVIYSKYIYVTGSALTATTQTYFKTKTQELATSQTDPKRENMLFSLRLKATTNWNTAISTQQFLADFGLTKMLKN